MSTTNNEDGAPKEVEYKDLDDLLGTSAATVVVPNEKKTVLSKDKDDDLSFLDNDLKDHDDEEEEEDEPAAADPKQPLPPVDNLADVLDDPEPEEEEEEEEEEKDADGNPIQKKPAPGRPKLSKDAMVEATKKLIEKGILQPFDDDKDLADYTIDDFQELIEANIVAKTETVAKEAPLQIFGQLPEDVQKVIAYSLNGGTDTKSILQSVLQSQEIVELNVEKEEDQKSIIRSWLQSIEYGPASEIEDEITSIEDRGDLRKKAEAFKPQLDAKQAGIIQKKLADQEAANLRAQEAAKEYSNKIHAVLATGELNGIKIDNKIQNMLYYGLTDSKSYQDKSGKPTTMLGHLLEEHQFGKNPNQALIAEALWLLSDPENYRNSVKSVGKKESTKETYRALKAAEAGKLPSSSSQEVKKEVPVRRTAPSTTTNKNGKGLFSRTLD